MSDIIGTVIGGVAGMVIAFAIIIYRTRPTKKPAGTAHVRIHPDASNVIADMIAAELASRPEALWRLPEPTEVISLSVGEALAPFKALRDEWQDQYLSAMNDARSLQEGTREHGEWLANAHHAAEKRDELDGILTDHAAAVAAHNFKVWDEGYTAGHSNAMRRMSDEPLAPTTPNPYRKVKA